MTDSNKEIDAANDSTRGPTGVDGVVGVAGNVDQTYADSSALAAATGFPSSNRLHDGIDCSTT